MAVLVRMQRGSVQIKSQGYHFPYFTTIIRFKRAERCLKISIAHRLVILQPFKRLKTYALLDLKKTRGQYRKKQTISTIPK